MALVGDSGAIYALYDKRDRHHAAVSRCIDREEEAIIVLMAILAEIDYLLRERLGHRAALRFLEGVSIGGIMLEPLTSADVARCRARLELYADLRLGLADAAVISTAERLGVHRILTVGERHFRVIRSINGKPFTLLPADS
jgi:predicted nucleic acid-binding protein